MAAEEDRSNHFYGENHRASVWHRTMMKQDRKENVEDYLQKKMGNMTINANDWKWQTSKLTHSIDFPLNKNTIIY